MTRLSNLREANERQAALIEVLEGRVKELEAKLAAVPLDAMLALNGPDDYDFSGLMSDIEKFADWLEPLRAQRDVSKQGDAWWT